MAETNAAEKWIYATLAADATLTGLVGTRIYRNRVPQDVTSPYPCVVFAYLSGRDRRGVGTWRAWSNTLYVVRGIDETENSLGPLKTVADRIDAVLHGASGATSEGTVWAAVREEPYSLSEEGPGGRIFEHLGGIYRILAK
jgi:hypothetical protein